MPTNPNTVSNLLVGQKEKETTINSNFSAVPKYLGEFTADPVTTGVAYGSTYFNSSTNNVRILLTTGVWQII